ncbi:MAG: nitrilase-related carbon-nitrogen hydrolase, partial [Alphaproteobacteria bacterium]
MTDTLTIALAQLNPTVGDIDGNIGLIRDARADAAAAGADLVITSELVVCGYPPEDLVIRPIVQETIEREIAALALETADGGPAVLVGTPWVEDGKLYNAALLLDGGEIAAMRFKHDLPNYGVFDEKRVFAAGPLPGPVNFRGVRLGVMVCEDMWTVDVAECLEESGAEILTVLNGSPFEQDKWDTRLNLAVARATECRMPLIYVNQVGGQDELVFDGASFVL